MSGPNYENLYKQKRLQIGIHDEIIARYNGFFANSLPETVAYYESLLNPVEAVVETSVEETTEEEPKKSKKK